MAYNKTPFKMMGKSPMMKALVGKQGNLPMHLQEKILASPVKQKESLKKGSDLTEAEKKKMREESVFGPEGKRVAKPPKNRKKARAREQMKQDSSGVKDVMTGAPAKMYKKSPVKQVKVKDLPEKAVEAGENIVKGVKKLGKKIGNITLVSKEKQDCKKKGGRFKKGKCYMPESPAKKKGCSKKY